MLPTVLTDSSKRDQLLVPAQPSEVGETLRARVGLCRC